MKKLIVTIAMALIAQGCQEPLEKPAAEAPPGPSAPALAEPLEPGPVSPEPAESDAGPALPEPEEPAASPALLEPEPPGASPASPELKEPGGELESPPIRKAAMAYYEEDDREYSIQEHPGLSNTKKGWYFNRNAEHTPPTAQREIDLNLYNGYYLGNTEEKEVYLTFDEGYENGFTGAILDVLGEKQVPAAFFLTKPYIRSQPELVLRMVDEGHIAANHSVTHPSFPELSDGQVEEELRETARFFQETTGAPMSKYFRPPSGEYSERVLALANDLGYKTIFWSFAYKDWLTDQQPGRAAAYKTVMDNLHPGAIILLHAVSESNAQALPDIIDDIRAQGYIFKSLDELPEK